MYYITYIVFPVPSSCVNYSDDDSLIAASCKDHYGAIWDVNSKHDLKYSLIGHTASVVRYANIDLH
jgi:WD40 repeat protein